jgi:hypothetical protein
MSETSTTRVGETLVGDLCNELYVLVRDSLYTDVFVYSGKT